MANGAKIFYKGQKVDTSNGVSGMLLLVGSFAFSTAVSCASSFFGSMLYRVKEQESSFIPSMPESEFGTVFRAIEGGQGVGGFNARFGSTRLGWYNCPNG